jgi:hypothetical protein
MVQVMRKQDVYSFKKYKCNNIMYYDDITIIHKKIKLFLSLILWYYHVMFKLNNMKLYECIESSIKLIYNDNYDCQYVL